MKILVALVLLFIKIAWALNITAKASQANGRILNGVNAAEGQFPYVVLLETDKAYCGGALIGREWVVTAAHCVFRQINIFVYLGVTYLRSAEVAYRVNRDSIVIYAGYNDRTLANDIALIKIPTTDICKNMFPVPLPALDSSHRRYTHEVASVSGWGRNGNRGLVSERLKWTTLPIISNEECAPFYPSVVESDICASTTGGSAACEGDSGGPLVLMGMPALVGIYSSSTLNGCESREPLIFTRITSYLQWIKNVTGISY